MKKTNGRTNRRFASPAALRAQRKFSNANNVILPVQPCSKKYSASHATQISGLCGPSRPKEGRIAIVTDAGRDVVDADGALDETC